MHIAFLGDFAVDGSVSIELNTYMPPVCKDIIPQVLIVTTDGVEAKPLFWTREADRFIYKYHFINATGIEKLKILSKTIKATPPDQRVLSFPFISLNIKNSNESVVK